MLKKLKLNTKFSFLDSLFVFFFRGVSMGGKYLTAILAYSFLSSSEYITFGIVLAAVNFFVLVVGLDIYQVSQKIHINATKRQSTNVYFSELITAFAVLLSLSFLAIIYFSFSKEPFFLPLVVTGITLCDYLILSSARVFLAKGNVILSSVVTSGRVFPLLVICVYFLFFKKQSNFTELIYIWLAIDFLVCLLVTFLLFYWHLEIFSFSKFKYTTVDFKTALLYWVCSMANYFLLFVDKIMVKSLSVNVEDAASYVFYMNVFSLIPSSIDALIIIPYFKKIVEAAAGRNTFLKLSKKMLNTSVIIGLIMLFSGCVLIIVQGNYSISMMHQKAMIFLVTCFINLFFALNAVVGIFLYSMSLNRAYLISHIIQLFIFAVAGIWGYFSRSLFIFLPLFMCSYFVLFYIKLSYHQKYKWQLTV
ncbi:MAG: hypothetical protein JST07_01765 [Bacteroidetes bacterium]|nr:hypothetical protein [Bacteroidota bacterium]